MPSDDDKNATLMREMLQQSQQATQDLIAALPEMFAPALAGARAAPPDGAAGNAATLQPSAKDLRDRKVPDFWEFWEKQKQTQTGIIPKI